MQRRDLVLNRSWRTVVAVVRAVMSLWPTPDALNQVYRNKRACTPSVSHLRVLAALVDLHVCRVGKGDYVSSFVLPQL